MDQKRRWMMGVIVACLLTAGCILPFQQVIFAKNADTEDVSDSETPEEHPDEKPEEKPEEPVPQIYEIQYDSPDGENGYYRTKPTVKIISRDERNFTKYLLKMDGIEVGNGCLEGVDQTMEIASSNFGEGIILLEIWMEDEEGIEIAESRKQVTFMVDTMAPTISMTAPNGFDVWYDGDVPVGIEASEVGRGSGLGYVRSFINGTLIDNVDVSASENAEVYAGNVQVTESSVNGSAIFILAEIVDRAGNRANMTNTVFIDREAPQIVWGGVSDYQISGKPLSLTGSVTDENGISYQSAQVHFCDTAGKESSRDLSEWLSTPGENTRGLCLDQDGSYTITAETSDKAGHTVEQMIHVTIDQTSPIIRYVDQLSGSYLPYFEWNYESGDMVSDFTSYEYHMKMDGILYQSKQRISSEGIHMFQVDAVDAAGNKNEIQAAFVIDHTPPKILFGNVEDEMTYEEGIVLNISTEEDSDYIQKIVINGEKQKTNAASRYFQFPMQEAGVYEVNVTASDLTGNRTQQTITFEIKDEATIKSIVLEPVKKVLDKIGVKQTTRKDKNEIQDAEEQKELKTYQIALMLLIAIGIMVCASWQIYENLKRYNKKPPHKREDAK